LKADQVLADRACDADRLCDLILDQGGEPVIAPRRQRWRRIATPYDEVAANFPGFVKLAGIMFWPR
jgi:transposase